MRLALVYGFLALQLSLPASYYFWREDPRDERFAWRMLSSLRFEACSIRFFEGATRRPVDARADMTLSFFTQMREGRQVVIRKYARQRCAGMRARGEQPLLHANLVCRPAESDEVVAILEPDRNLCE